VQNALQISNTATIVKIMWAYTCTSVTACKNGMINMQIAQINHGKVFPMINTWRLPFKQVQNPNHVVMRIFLQQDKQLTMSVPNDEDDNSCLTHDAMGVREQRPEVFYKVACC